ncbi:MAG: DUF3014 domain-containing protein [Acidobacteriota bacterium]|nr:DUF3014 domain-containing protein [Acidobacteriota bacterium]
MQVTPEALATDSSRRHPGPFAGVTLVALLAAGATFFLFSGEPPVETSPPLADATPVPIPRPAAPPVEEPTEEVGLPALVESDDVVRDMVASLTSHPGLAAWLIPDNLVRTFVVVVENAADGDNPAEHLIPLRPTQRFRTSGTTPELVIDPVSHNRYNTHAEIVAAIDPTGAAELYHSLEPLIAEAYAELGHPDGGFDTTILRALRNVLETPVLEREVRLIPRAAFFEFADDELEDLLPVQKQLMAMGPRNVRAVQASLLDMARAIGLDTSDLPVPTAVR